MFKEGKKERWKVMSHASQKRRASSCVQFENLDFFIFVFKFTNDDKMSFDLFMNVPTKIAQRKEFICIGPCFGMRCKPRTSSSTKRRIPSWSADSSRSCRCTSLEELPTAGPSEFRQHAGLYGSLRTALHRTAWLLCCRSFVCLRSWKLSAKDLLNYQVLKDSMGKFFVVFDESHQFVHRPLTSSSDIARLSLWRLGRFGGWSRRTAGWCWSPTCSSR